MHPKKKITITGDGENYIFVVSLDTKRIELILQHPFFSPVDTIIGMNSVPDIVQIKFYKELQRLTNEYKASSTNSE